MNDKKKKLFKDTKLGLFLKEKAPKILDAVGDALPDEGVLGIVKNLLDTEPAMTPEERAESQRLFHELTLEEEKLRVADRDSARNREIDFVKATGKRDYMQALVGLIGLTIFGFLVYAIIFVDIPVENREAVIHIIGVIEGVVLSIFGYFYGTSKGSSDKTNIFKHIWKK